MLCDSYYFLSHPAFSFPFPFHFPIEPGNLALNDQVYSQGIGGFDKVAIDYGYRIFDKDDENSLLIKLIDDAESNGYSFLNDQVGPALPSPAHYVSSDVISSPAVCMW
jgi:Met-zincin